jgi:5,10-methylenetetrahydrofolate reductase
MAASFKKALKSGKFIVTSEVAPPKGINLEKMIHHIELLKDKVDAINVTDHQSSVMRFPSLGGALLIKEMGGEPILQMTCRDRNRMALQADLFFAASRGINNVLCLTGDSVILGDHKEAKGVFDLDSSQLLAAIRRLEKGKDLGGNDVDGSVSFCAGAIVTPEATMARFMNKNVAGVSVPQELIDEMASAPKGRAIDKGIEIAGRMIKRVGDEKMCDGVHIMAIGKEELVPDIMSAAGLD